ncbi:MAG: DUF1080 domain-containing protein [Candidatus Eisenbacteria bacterium]|nr:DUF1080 domain-containing protein [Candidatus Eisenbacteria bacterium]
MKTILRYAIGVAALLVLVAAKNVTATNLAATNDETRLALPSSPPRPVKPAGKVLFSDDFSKGLHAWSPDREGVWTVVRGMLRADLPDQKQLRSLIYAGDTSWTDIAVDVDVCMMRGVDKGVVVRVMDNVGLGVDLRGGGYQDVLVYQRELPMGRASATNANGTWNHLRLEVKGAHFKVFVNGELKIERTELKFIRPKGRIALPAYTGGVGQCTVYYDNVVVTALE